MENDIPARCWNCRHLKKEGCKHPSNKLRKKQDILIPQRRDKDERICGWHEFADDIEERRKFILLEKVV